MVSIEILDVKVEGGPSELAVCDKSGLVVVKIFGGQCGCILGSPLPQALVGVGTGAVTAGVRRGGGTYAWRSPRIR
jgi:hypothetical protein